MSENPSANHTTMQEDADIAAVTGGRVCVITWFPHDERNWNDDYCLRCGVRARCMKINRYKPETGTEKDMGGTI